MRKKAPPPRVRRSAEDARTAIMDATEQRLVASGPAGIRLQDVADDVGVSHPTILHHFGSRDRLVEAVITRRVHAMHHEVILALVGAPHGTANGGAPAAQLFERLFQMLGPGGHARVVAFLALEGRVPGADPQSLLPMAQAAHVARTARLDPEAPRPSLEDTYFTVLLGAFALFGEAIVGPLFRGEPDDRPDLETSQRFREWLARLVVSHLEGGPP